MIVKVISLNRRIKMNHQQERVFAYGLAKTICDSELENVSGGSFHWTHGQTAKATGGSGQGIEVVADVTIDW